MMVEEDLAVVKVVGVRCRDKVGWGRRLHPGRDLDGAGIKVSCDGG